MTVDIAWPDKGLGTRLMKHLEMAQSMGIQRMFAFSLVENLQMRDLASFLGFQTQVDEEHPERVGYELDLAGAS